MDRFTPEERSRMMSRIAGKNTRPERIVRSLLHRLGYRYRLHVRELPGSPDIVLPRYRAVVFVHGCFWHRHPNCKDATLPKANTEFWTRKLNANVERDRSAASALRSRGWHIIYVWECEIGDVESLASRLFAELDSALGVAR